MSGCQGLAGRDEQTERRTFRRMGMLCMILSRMHVTAHAHICPNPKDVRHRVNPRAITDAG